MIEVLTTQGTSIEILQSGAPTIQIFTAERGPAGPPGVGDGGGGGSVPSVTTSGTSTAYTATAGLTTLAGLLVLRLHVTNGVSPQINLDGLGAKPLLLKAGAVPPAGALPANQPLLAEVSSSAVTIINEV